MTEKRKRQAKQTRGPVHDREPARRYAAVVAAENIRTLMDYYRERDDARGTYEGLALKSSVGKSTIWDILADPERSTTVAKLHGLAVAFGLEAWQLLVPNLNPAQPPSLLTPQQIDKLRRFEDAQRALLPGGQGEAVDSSRPDGRHRDRADQAAVSGESEQE